MHSSLSLEYQFSQDGDDFGWLAARLNTPAFSGQNGMWVQWQDLMEFSASLIRYPISHEDPVSSTWGFGEDGRHVDVTKISIASNGQTGALIADVELANYHQPAHHRCLARFETDYPAVQEFAKQLDAMMRKEAPSATLNGFGMTDP